ncbi:LysR family transcriptional regulator [Bradyrhizobium sp. ISRA463]|uniref:helix-turn-helix domain-containing protein n=1 Tax=Bradyrhizobium sp. ISRA463 TaxID=2866199 RepID=UPI0032B0328B
MNGSGRRRSFTCLPRHSERRNFTRAATKLGMTQPALSRGLVPPILGVPYLLSQSAPAIAGILASGSTLYDIVEK